MKRWFRLSYKSLRKTVVYLQGKRKEKEAEMLVLMQFRSFSDAMKDIELIFRQNKHLKLHRSRVFRAWYKHEIDHMTDNPEIYSLSMTDGTPYDKERDPFYSPTAPDWAQFDRKHYADEGGDADYRDNSRTLKKAAEEGFFTGIGLGVTDNFLTK